MRADTGLQGSEVLRRQAIPGPNAFASDRAHAWAVLRHQMRSPLLFALRLAAGASYVVGERSSAVIIGVIVALSVGLGFVSAFRAEKSAEALHSQIRHQPLAVRDGERVSVEVTDLVPGDIVELHQGGIVPAAFFRSRPSLPLATVAVEVVRRREARHFRKRRAARFSISR